MTTPDFEALYRAVSPSVVSVYTGPAGRGSGSGFVYDLAPDGTGHVVTNHHVVVSGGRPGRPARPHGDGRGSGRSRRREHGARVVDQVDVRFADGTWREGRVVGADAYTDLAVIAVRDPPASAVALPVASETPTPGRPVAALGNPMGLDGTMTVGVVSGVNRSMTAGVFDDEGERASFAIPDVVQTDAPINPGNSGGPLVAAGPTDGVDWTDPRYEVVGVNRARQGDNIGFAVSPLVVRRVVPSLVASGRHRHPYLQVRTLDLSPSVAAAVGLDADEVDGVLVVEAPAGSGLRGATGTTAVRGRRIPTGGDVVVAVDGRPVRAHEELMRYLVLDRDPGETVDLTVRRGDDEETVTMTLRERPSLADVGADEADADGEGNGSVVPID